MSNRDELATTIRENRTPWVTNTEHRQMEEKQADAILAAGYSKPRTITTLEELDALPVGAIVRGANGLTCERQEHGPWCDGPHNWRSFEGVFWEELDINLPATVLHEGATA